LRSEADDLARSRDALAASRDALANSQDALAAVRDPATIRTVADWTGSEGDRHIAEVRRTMAARCAQRGRPVPPDLDWSRLALCGDTGAGIAARVDAHVHRQLAEQGIE
jgi:transposase InsO family protein